MLQPCATGAFFKGTTMLEAFLNGVSAGIGLVVGAAFAFVVIFKLAERRVRPRDEFVMYQPCSHGADPKNCVACKLFNMR